MPTVVIPITAEGAVVEVLVGVSQLRANFFKAANLPVPSPLQLRLLVDTGADMTSIQAGLLAPLGIVPTGSIQLHTPSTGGNPVQCDQYEVGIVFARALPNPWPVDILPIFECQKFIGTYQGLLGRDILDQSVLTYNSFGQTVTISF
jgi:hypothetical protein